MASFDASEAQAEQVGRVASLENNMGGVMAELPWISPMDRGGTPGFSLELLGRVGTAGRGRGRAAGWPSGAGTGAGTWAWVSTEVETAAGASAGALTAVGASAGAETAAGASAAGGD